MPTSLGMMLVLGGALVLAAAQESATSAAYIPAGGRGSWADGGSTGLVLIYASLMRNGDIVGWANGYAQFGALRSVVYWREAGRQRVRTVLGPAAIHGGETAFCAAHVATADDRILIFGGHRTDRALGTFREYSHNGGRRPAVRTLRMPSPRWYPSALTLADGRVLVVGGVVRSGRAEYGSDARYNNPTYTVYDPRARRFSPDWPDMGQQLQRAFPVVTYPHLVLLPDGGVAVSAGRTLAKYRRSGATRFARVWDYQARPGAPWSYPQTGVGLPLPMAPPYRRLEFLATGGTSRDRADERTPASNAAHVIDLTAGPRARWRSVGPMPYPRVMGDGVVLCDGTILFTSGASRGYAGWGRDPVTFRFRDGGSVTSRRGFSTRAYGWLFEPVIYNPATRQWSRRGSLAQMNRPRLYHSQAILLPSCKVLVGGSDVTRDTRAEVFSPPYLNLGPRPVITAAPSSARIGREVVVSYTSQEPVTRALLLRTGTHTHSTTFDARSLWLEIAANQRGRLRLRLPRNANVLPPGVYMLTLNTRRGVPSDGSILTIT